MAKQHKKENYEDGATVEQLPGLKGAMGKAQTPEDFPEHDEVAHESPPRGATTSPEAVTENTSNTRAGKHHPTESLNAHKVEAKQSKDDYGKAKKDMGGYIGERASAGDEDNPESLPGGA